ncbi:afadin- and alpha-actinin-binding protein-like [Huso huso]|uniref:Afadin- and alpha-actinin-binding protein-like n=1 Tax=Huso huso TaxID=61971 RepID=A0ABR0ZGZ7_HUSHU
MPCTADLYQTLCLIPDKSSPRTQPKRSSVQDTSIKLYSSQLSTPKPILSVTSEDSYICSITGDENKL